MNTGDAQERAGANRGERGSREELITSKGLSALPLILERFRVDELARRGRLCDGRHGKPKDPTRWVRVDPRR